MIKERKSKLKLQQWLTLKEIQNEKCISETSLETIATNKFNFKPKRLTQLFKVRIHKIVLPPVLCQCLQ